MSNRYIASVGLLAAITIVLQLMGSFIKLGTFSVSLVLIPIVVTAALYGKNAGSFVGFVFGATVLLSGDAALFLGVNPIGTFITVLVKGILAGYLSGLVYEKLSGKFKVILSAITCPLVNTGIFLIGCRLFFFDFIKEMAGSSGYDNVLTFMLLALVGGNFIFELITNVLLSPMVVQIIKIREND